MNRYIGWVYGEYICTHILIYLTYLSILLLSQHINLHNFNKNKKDENNNNKYSRYINSKLNKRRREREREKKKETTCLSIPLLC